MLTTQDQEKASAAGGAMWAAGHRLLKLITAEREARTAYLTAVRTHAVGVELAAKRDMYIDAQTRRQAQAEQLIRFSQQLDEAAAMAVRAVERDPSTGVAA